MTDKLTQQQVQELAVRYQQYQYQAEAMAQQMNMVNVTVQEVETALTTITVLKEEPAGRETLVPIGFGSFVSATLTSPDKVVIGIGAGVSVEKNVDDAKVLLEKRKDELTKYYETLGSTVTKLTQEMQKIQAVLEKEVQPQQPMRAE